MGARASTTWFIHIWRELIRSKDSDDDKDDEDEDEGKEMGWWWSVNYL